MRKLNLVVMMIAVMVSIAAFAYAADSPSQICSSHGDFGVSHDACVVCVNNGAGNEATCMCKLLQDGYFGISLQDAGFKNLGQCISSFHH